MNSQRYPDKFGARRASITANSATALPSLSEKELAQVRELSSLHAELLPEFEPFLKELFRHGLIDGRRALVSVCRTNPSDISTPSTMEPTR